MACNNLSYLRNKQDLTQQEVADKIGMARSYISELERGKISITQKTKIRLAKALNVDENEIEGG